MAHYMKKNIEEVAEQIKADNHVRASLAILSSRLIDRYQKILEFTYFDPELRDIYEALRNASEFKFMGDAKTIRSIVKFPNEYVYQFLNDIFSKQYGPEWLTDKQTFLKICKTEDLIKPWITVRKL